MGKIQSNLSQYQEDFDDKYEAVLNNKGDDVEVIGAGAFSIVYLFKENETKDYVAVKKILYKSKDDDNSVMIDREVQLLA